MHLKQNLILLTIDCLRADGVSCLGSTSNITPNLDELAKAGALFSQAISNGCGTPESFPSIMTSTYALMNPNSGGSEGNFWVKLSNKWPTIAEVLKSSGFSTAAFNANPYITSFSHYDRGFEVFDDSLKHYRSNSFLDRLHRKLGTLFGNKFLRADKVNQKAISWLNRARHNPNGFFLWLHYMDAHSPYNPKKISMLRRVDAILLERKVSRNPEAVSEEELQRLMKFYHEEIRYIDGEIGSLVEKLRKMDIYLDNTFFIVTADHGEQFMEHGQLGHGRLYDEVIRVPLIISGPEIKGNTVIEDQVSLLDLGPTVLDLVNIPKPETFLGTTLLPTIKGKARDPNNYVISETLTQNFSCRTKNWKYITNMKDRHELYNLKIDPKEKVNLASKHPKKVKDFNMIVSKCNLMIEKARRSVPEEHNVPSIEELEVLEERLKSLGYL